MRPVSWSKQVRLRLMSKACVSLPPPAAPCSPLNAAATDARNADPSTWSKLLAAVSPIPSAADHLGSSCVVATTVATRLPDAPPSRLGWRVGHSRLQWLVFPHARHGPSPGLVPGFGNPLLKPLPRPSVRSPAFAGLPGALCSHPFLLLRFTFAGPCIVHSTASWLHPTCAKRSAKMTSPDPLRPNPFGALTGRSVLRVSVVACASTPRRRSALSTRRASVTTSSHVFGPRRKTSRAHSPSSPQTQ